MGIETAIFIALVVSAAVSIKSMQDQKSAAKKNAKLQQERLDLERQQSALAQGREEARLRRESRTKRAGLANRAAAAGSLFTTPVEGQLNAVGMDTGRELNYVEKGAALKSQADDITAQQIENNKDNIINQATLGQIGAVAGAVGQAGTLKMRLDGFKGQESARTTQLLNLGDAQSEGF